VALVGMDPHPPSSQLRVRLRGVQRDVTRTIPPASDAFVELRSTYEIVARSDPTLAKHVVRAMVRVRGMHHGDD
jgi:hypothetical protein